LRAAERASEIDPDNEAGLRRVISLHARVGDRASALRVYERFARRLKEDWNAGPDSATLALVEAVRTGTVGIRRGASDRSPHSRGPDRLSFDTDGRGGIWTFPAPNQRLPLAGWRCAGHRGCRPGVPAVRRRPVARSETGSWSLPSPTAPGIRALMPSDLQYPIG
jgi:hypothetical protein